ncbi:SDR family NAD(P)-dependent oxidoreductase [Desulfococcaceae bacterium HSG8]|nr:SDR family NAD(P)-dependent oxidoreductase [Desulfococcaceae bacterium HSG8]
MTDRFTNKTAVITGASSGIGATAARQFAAEGARVVLAARRRDALEEIAESIGKERALAVPTDVTIPDSAADLLKQAEDHFGAVHILVNNAGYNSRGDVETKPVNELTHILNVNLTAPVTLCRLVLPYLRRAGGGAIVNVASLAGRVPLPHEAAYCATKSGLRAFTAALAEELEGSGITVSAVSPGPVYTDFIMSDIDDVPDIVFSQPMSSPEDIASHILECAYDGKTERAVPRLSGYLTTAGYVIPRLRRILKPLLERRGRLNKERYRNMKK